MTSDVKAVFSMYKFDFIEINKCLGIIFINTVALFAKYISFHKHAFGLSFSNPYCISLFRRLGVKSLEFAF